MNDNYYERTHHSLEEDQNQEIRPEPEIVEATYYHSPEPEPVIPPKAKKEHIHKPFKKRWYVKIAAYVMILTFVSGFTFGAGYLTAGLTKGSLPFVNTANDSAMAITDTDSTAKIQQIQSVVTTNPTGNTISTIAKEVSPAIVTISSYAQVTTNNFFGQSSGVVEGTGSGIIFDIADNDNALIVTNYHVIEGGQQISIAFQDGSEVGVDVLGYNSRTDLAVLSVPVSDLQQHLDTIVIATFGDSDAVSVGETAIAIGNPLGTEYELTVTAGIISGIGRDIYIDQNTTAVNLIQTDAAINPGNSGGALLNARGEVIGINSAKYVDTSVEGIGFAIPINDAKEVIANILEVQDGSDVSYALSDDRAFLGVQISDITSEIYAETGMRFGVYITSVYPYSGADEAGIQAGDIIYSIDGHRIANVQALFTSLENAAVGDTISVGVIRGDDILSLEAPLYSYKEVMDQQEETINN